MSYQKSFSEIDNKHWADFKKHLNESANASDSKKLFSKTIADLLADIDPAIGATYGEFESDFMIEEDGYSISENISENEVFKGLLIISDLPAIIERYAEATLHRISHQNSLGKDTNGKKLVH